MTGRPRERIVVFGPDDGLVGILTTPGTRHPGTPHVLLLNSGIIHRVGSSRMWVTLARALADVGIPSLRFDYSGIGDSDRRADATSIREAVEADLAAAMHHLVTAHGASHFLVVGLCSGAYDALRAARGEPRIVGVFMVDLAGPFQGWRHTVHHLRRRLLRPASWRNPLRKLLHHSRDIVGRSTPDGPDPVYVFGGRSTPSRQWLTEQFHAVLGRGVRLSFVFSAGFPENYNHRSQFRSTFSKVARHAGVTFAFYPEADHAFSGADVRRQLIQRTVEWAIAGLPAHLRKAP